MMEHHYCSGIAQRNRCCCV